MKQKTFTKIIKFIAWKSLGAFVFTAVAGTSLWALAAFTEPSSTPAASIQDFATNVLGANNTDNSFDSSSVSANADGSVLERLEALENRNDICIVKYTWTTSSTGYPTCDAGWTDVDHGILNWRDHYGTYYYSLYTNCCKN